MKPRTCSDCGGKEPEVQFYQIKSGQMSYCRVCSLKRSKNYSEKQKLRPRVSVARKKCVRCGVVKDRAQFHSNKWNLDSLCGYCKDCRIAYDRSPIQREHAKVNMRRYRKEHLSQPLTVGWWRERMHGDSFLGLKAKEVKELFDRQPYCLYCKEDLSQKPEGCHLDHKTPRSRGGENVIENITVACGACNRLKHTMTELEFRAFLKAYVQRFNKLDAKVYSLAEYAQKAVLA